MMASRLHLIGKAGSALEKGLFRTSKGMQKSFVISQRHLATTFSTPAVSCRACSVLDRSHHRYGSLLSRSLAAHHHQSFMMYSSENDSSPPQIKGSIFVIPNPIRWLMGKLFLYQMTTNVDPSFTLDEFVVGATQAMCYFSHLVASSDFTEMKNVASDEAVTRLREVTTSWTEEQQELVEITEADIQHSAPTISSIELKDDCYIADINFVLLAMKSVPQPFLIHMDVRFQRKYCDGHASDWTLNEINQLEVKPLG